MDNKLLTEITLDCYYNRVKKYSKEDAEDYIRQQLKEANGGSYKLNYKNLRDNPGLFSIMEDLIDTIREENINQNSIYSMFVEERNLSDGDEAKFNIEDATDLIMAESSYGNLGVRRQRIGEGQAITLTPIQHTLVLYDEFQRLMSGKIDINTLVDKVSQAIENKKLDEVYAIFSSLSKTDYNVDEGSGSYSEATFGDYIDKIEAMNKGNKVMLVTTKSMARKIKASDDSSTGKDSQYNNGYATKWNGIDVVAVPQRFQLGTTKMAFPTDKIFVVPVGDNKPIKIVNQGGTILDMDTTGLTNADQSVEITAQLAWATGFVSAGVVGKYTPAFV